MNVIVRFARPSAAAMVGAAAMLLTGCGGGGSSSAPTPASSAVTYSSSAAVGELVDYTIDTAKLIYSYTITESQYGLMGATGSGTLTLNSDGTYALSGIPGAKMAVLPNGLLLAAIQGSFGGTVRTVPVIGIHNPVATLSSAAGAYDFVQKSCLAGLCASAFGTFKLNGDGTWNSCAGGDISAATPSCTFQASGTVNSLGNGKWQVMQNGTDMGTVLAFSSGAQNVMIMDLKDARAGGFGVGVIVGSSEQSVSSAQTNGTWVALGTDGTISSFSTSGNAMSYSMMGGMMSSATGTMAMNSPWTGFVTPTVNGATGGVALMAGSGVYVYENAGYAQIGLKVQ